MRVDQWVPALHRGDAVGDSARMTRDRLRAWGHESEIYAWDLSQEEAPDARAFADWRPGSASDIVILHYALASPLSAALKEQPSRKLLMYHNVTPAEFFQSYDSELAHLCALGREELADLAGSVDLALAPSEFNREELDALGFRRTARVPIFIDFDRYQAPASATLMRQLADGRLNMLFVGRISPQKRHEDILRVAHYWKHFISPNVRALFVGKIGRPLGYFDALQSFAYDRGFSAAEVVFSDHVDHSDLLAYYRSAHVFVSMSEHEGFGVPLVESMLLRVPVLAYAAGAVEETLGGSALLVREKNYGELGELAHTLATDTGVRTSIINAQQARSRAFAPEIAESELRRALESLLI